MSRIYSREEAKQHLIKLLVNKGAIRFGDRFVLKSGRISPYFINFTLLNDGESILELKKIFSSFVYHLIKDGELENFSHVFGPAYKGIILSSILAEGLYEYLGYRISFVYDRKEEKKYGDTSMDRLIVGIETIKQDSKVLIVDDILTTGLTKLQAIDKLRQLTGCKVIGLVVGVDRQERVEDRKTAKAIISEKLGIPVFTIASIGDIFEEVKNSLSPETVMAMLEYLRANTLFSPK